MTPEERFWAKVDVTPGCWQWTGSLSRYGQFGVNGHLVYAHRFAYELLVSPIPTGLQIDHLCRNKACVNPAHLEPVTPQENTLRGTSFAAANARKTHCRKGHPYAGDNLGGRPGRDRECRTCRAEQARIRYWTRCRQTVEAAGHEWPLLDGTVAPDREEAGA